MRLDMAPTRINLAPSSARLSPGGCRRQHLQSPPEPLPSCMSARGTRGAAAAIAWLDDRTLEGWVAGVGNVRCRLFGAVTRTVEFADGVLGQRVRSPRPVAFALRPADVVILFSDGVAGRFRLDDYPSLGLDPAPEIAFNVVRRFGKGADDASCAVIRCRW
jgi:negative regulator of sigma-B (phosphoserine phosphatase)